MQEINEVNFIHYYVNTKGKNPTYLFRWKNKMTEFEFHANGKNKNNR